jgi:hypothetical protein
MVDETHRRRKGDVKILQVAEILDKNDFLPEPVWSAARFWVITR